MRNSVIVVSPANIATGGTEVLQQLCFQINKLGGNAFMYYTEPFENSVVSERFAEYHNPRLLELQDVEGNSIIVPETWMDCILNVRHARLFIWWLSVDNYYGSGRLQVNLAHKLFYSLKDRRNQRIFMRCDHLVQSEYARNYLLEEKGVSADQIRRLSDYLNRAFLEQLSEGRQERENLILYNPRKDAEISQLLRDEITEYQWVALQGFRPDEMRSVMRRSKVYVDFGNHPGKDRIPREAALCGCCVITGMSGAAANDKDIPIDRKYKFQNPVGEKEKIHDLIRDCMDRYENRKMEFENYRTVIQSEEKNFTDDIKRIFLTN